MQFECNEVENEAHIFTNCKIKTSNKPKLNLHENRWKSKQTNKKYIYINIYLKKINRAIKTSLKEASPTWGKVWPGPLQV